MSDHISRALETVYAPQTTNEERKALESNLELWKKSDDSVKVALDYFSGTPSPNSRHLNYFLSTTLHYHTLPKIQNRMNAEARGYLEGGLKKLVSEKPAVDNQSMSKIMSSYVSCCKNSVSYNDYTSSLEITNLAKSKNPLALNLLEVMVEEMPRFDHASVMKGANRTAVANFLSSGKDHFLEAFSANVTSHNDPLTLPALRGVLTMLNWGNRFPITKSITVHLSADLIHKLFKIAEESTENQTAVAALMCLNECLEFSKWNPHNPRLLDLLRTLALSVVNVTNSFSKQIPPNVVDDDENGYAVQLSNMLSTFAKKHIRKCISIGFDATLFMSSVGNMTFKVSTYPALVDVIDTWVEVAIFVDCNNPEISQGFSEILIGLINKNLFRFNRDMLEELELTFPEKRVVDPSEETIDEEYDPESKADEQTDQMQMALKSSEIGTLLWSTSELAKHLTTKSPLCATKTFDALESLLTQTLTKITTTYDPEDSWDALAILYLFETSVAASSLLHASATHFPKFLSLSNNLLNFTSQLSNAKAWSGQQAIVNIVVACTSALSSMNQTLWGWTEHHPDTLLQPTTELSTSILSLVSSFISEQSVLPAPERVTSAFCSLAHSIGVCSKSHYNYFSVPPLSDARVAVSRALVAATPSLSKHGGMMCFEAVTLLTMSSGFERSRNKVNAQLVASDSEMFMTIALQPLVSSLKTLLDSVVPTNPQSIPSLAPSIDRTSFALSSVLNASSELSVDTKNATLKQALSSSIQPLLQSLSIFSSISLSPSSTSAINNATSSLLLLLLSILTTLNKELGTDFKILVISTLVEALSSITPSPSPLTTSQTMVVRMLNKTLVTVFSAKNSSLAPVISSAMDLIANKIAPICKANEDNTASLLPSLLSTSYVILVSQWSMLIFKEPATVAPALSVGVKVAGLPTAPRPALFASDLISQKKPARVKAEYAALFDALCSLFLFSVQADNMSPSVVSKGVKMLINLDEKAKLFVCVDFKERMRATFVAAILEDLLKLNQPLLVDDMNKLLFAMVSSDFDGFFKSILPSMIDSMGITSEEKISMLQTWSTEEDSVSFRQSCENFLSEFRYYQTK
mmetsp:Transcript_21748/g.45319  ORF Transcript_21748/g.45319 Transcript_21748/m.45319 type:complete len:1091 (-) Transcript_21748:37-3309(-)